MMRMPEAMDSARLQLCENRPTPLFLNFSGTFDADLDHDTFQNKLPRTPPDSTSSKTLYLAHNIIDLRFQAIICSGAAFSTT